MTISKDNPRFKDLLQLALHEREVVKNAHGKAINGLYCTGSIAALSACSIAAMLFLSDTYSGVFSNNAEGNLAKGILVTSSVFFPTLAISNSLFSSGNRSIHPIVNSIGKALSWVRGGVKKIVHEKSENIERLSEILLTHLNDFKPDNNADNEILARAVGRINGLQEFSKSRAVQENGVNKTIAIYLLDHINSIKNMDILWLAIERAGGATFLNELSNINKDDRLVTSDVLKGFDNFLRKEAEKGHYTIDEAFRYSSIHKSDDDDLVSLSRWKKLQKETSAKNLSNIEIDTMIESGIFEKTNMVGNEDGSKITAYIIPEGESYKIALSGERFVIVEPGDGLVFSKTGINVLKRENIENHYTKERKRFFIP